MPSACVCARGDSAAGPEHAEEQTLLQAREAIHKQTPGSGAGVWGANMGSVWDGGLSEALQAPAVISVPGKVPEAGWLSPQSHCFCTQGVRVPA